MGRRDAGFHGGGVQLSSHSFGSSGSSTRKTADPHRDASRLSDLTVTVLFLLTHRARVPRTGVPLPRIERVTTA